jgi:hypothetical protein
MSNWITNKVDFTMHGHLMAQVQALMLADPTNCGAYGMLSKTDSARNHDVFLLMPRAHLSRFPGFIMVNPEQMPDFMQADVVEGPSLDRDWPEVARKVRAELPTTGNVSAKPKLNAHAAAELIRGMGREATIIVHDDGQVTATAISMRPDDPRFQNEVDDLLAKIRCKYTIVK